MTGGRPTPGTVHVVGAGLAGLAAALALSRGDRTVVMHEASGHAGGRCRSFHDERLGCRIDNGNHLLLSANRAALGYLREIGAEDSLVASGKAFPFLDLVSGTRWTVRPGDGWLGRRLLAPIRQVPGAQFSDLLGLLRLALAGKSTTVLQVLGPGPLMERFWRPLTVAVLNAEPEAAAAGLLHAALRDLIADGGRGAVALTARHGLSESFVEPALAILARRGVKIGFHRRLRAIDHDARAVSALHFQAGTVEITPADSVVLAVPPGAAADLLPDMPVPMASSPIVNAHFRLEAPSRLPEGGVFLGLTGGTAQWLFLRDRIASVTVSAAETLVDRSADALVPTLWRDAAAALGMPASPPPPARVVKERQATFRQDPAGVARRPAARTGWVNLALAGDWTDTGLPATIEGAIRSGQAAAAVLQAG